MTVQLDILVVGSHPDDAEIGAGGTIAHYKKNGKKIGILDCSNGEPTPFGTVEHRKLENYESSKILDVDIRITLDMPNRYITNTIENRRKIAEVFREYMPKIIITHPANDWHPDHVAVHQLVNAAKFHSKLTKTESKLPEYYPSRVIYFDHSHIKVPRTPDFLIDISDSLDDKLNALRCYKSQFTAKKRALNIFDFLRERAGYLGYQVGVRYAEGFNCPEYYLIEDITTII